MDPANPQTLNRYSYVLNNPMRYIDPSGLDHCEGYNPTDKNGNYPGALGALNNAYSTNQDYQACLAGH